jgi:hypothetical protein
MKLNDLKKIYNFNMRKCKKNGKAKLKRNLHSFQNVKLRNKKSYKIKNEISKFL